jgi:hypothetical protein
MTCNSPRRRHHANANDRGTAAIIAAGALLGWLAGTGRLALAEANPGQADASAQPPAGGYVLPKPPQPFRGTINLRAKDSKSDFPQPIKAPASAPNILLVLLDDVGFGATSPFGGPCNTPTLDALVKTRLRYNHFHTTALCSPTRAALLLAMGFIQHCDRRSGRCRAGRWGRQRGPQWHFLLACRRDPASNPSVSPVKS